MFGIGLWELLTVALVVVIFVRPADIPRLMRKLGRLYGQASSMSGAIMREIDAGRREAEDDVRRELKSRSDEEGDNP